MILLLPFFLATSLPAGGLPGDRQRIRASARCRSAGPRVAHCPRISCSATCPPPERTGSLKEPTRTHRPQPWPGLRRTRRHLPDAPHVYSGAGADPSRDGRKVRHRRVKIEIVSSSSNPRQQARLFSHAPESSVPPETRSPARLRPLQRSREVPDLGARADQRHYESGNSRDGISRRATDSEIADTC